MKTLHKTINDLSMAMKSKDNVRVSSLRLLKSELKNRQIEKGHDLGEEEIQSVIASLIRKGQDAAAQFRKGHREDLARKEEKEIEIFYGYLPRQLDPAEIQPVLEDIIAELSPNGLKDLGKIMKVAMARMAGKAQGKEVNEIAKRLLSELYGRSNLSCA
jgi:uncharacterized protein YqeY